MGDERRHAPGLAPLRLVTDDRPARTRQEGELRLLLPAESRSVGVLRAAVSALASAVGIEAERLEDLKLTVTEAAANVCVHAYRGQAVPGPLELEARADGSRLVVWVRDRGRGPQPRLDSRGLGLGLGLMSGLAESCRIAHRPGGGTEVELRFTIGPVRPSLGTVS
jgi:anti-sigma regulatory factor (Ser/Thr protein kinase)